MRAIATTGRRWTVTPLERKADPIPQHPALSRAVGQAAEAPAHPSAAASHERATVGLNSGAKGIGTSAVPKENRTDLVPSGNQVERPTA